MDRTRMRSTRLWVGALGAGALFAGALAATSAAGAAGEHKVTLCHATDSRTNPYVEITVDYHSVTHGGHGDHDGPVFAPDLPKHTKWGDIIPPFDFGGGAVYPGKNWPAGQTLLADGCAAEPATTTTEPPSTTTTEPPTTTTEPPTTTTEPPSTTTTEPPT